jgi:hypothetical protein
MATLDRPVGIVLNQGAGCPYVGVAHQDNG